MAAVLVGLVVPAIVALVELRSPRWLPWQDYALVELRLRDIAAGHPPLVGPHGRLRAFGEMGSHPGPLFFYALFPVYWLVGQTSWALQVAAASVNLAAMALVVWMGYRRGGRAVALTLVAGLALLARSYGFDKLTLPWNPNVAAWWWLVLLVAVWSLLCDDLAMLPVAVVAGSFCVQSHYGYVGLVGVLAVVAVAGAGRALLRRDGAEGRVRWDRVVRWVVPAVAVGVVLWLPPLIEQVGHTPGNLAILWDLTVHPDASAPGSPGLSRAVDIWLAHRDPTVLASHTVETMKPAPDGPAIAGMLLLAAWVAAVVVSWRARLGSVGRLHVVVGAAAVTELVSIDRITGPTFDYVVLWTWATTMLMVVALALTVLAVAERSFRAQPGRALRDPAGHRTKGLVWAPGVVAAGLALLLVGLSVYDAGRVRSRVAPDHEEVAAHLVPAAADALRSGRVPGYDDGDRYLVRAQDEAFDAAVTTGTFLLELDRETGLDVAASADIGDDQMSGSRRREPDEADAVLHLVIGEGSVARWQRTPGAVLVESYDPRTPAEMEECERLHRQVRELLEAEGQPEVADVADESVVMALLHPVSPEVHALLDRLYDLGTSGAVFVAPVGVTPDADRSAR